MLWTGGKDSCLALYRARERGIPIDRLATFVPHEGTFKAHPIDRMRRQAEQLALPIHFLPIRAPYRESYVAQLQALQADHGIGVLVTGDIDLVDGYPNWIVECGQAVGMDVIRPLWQETRLMLLEELLTRQIGLEISWVNHPALPSSWIGRTFDRTLLADLVELNRTAGIDVCGENGEYHTMATALPPFVST
jgi:uncharacterized protein (TIGR00290 family)